MKVKTMQHNRLHKVTLYNGDQYVTVEVNARDATQACNVAYDMVQGIVVAVRRMPLKRRPQHDAHCRERQYIMRLAAHVGRLRPIE